MKTVALTERNHSSAIGHHTPSFGHGTSGISFWTFRTMLSGIRQPSSGEDVPAKRRIMLVDDEKDVSAIFKSGLERRGFEVDVFTDPLSALAQYQSGRYHLLLLDVRMPMMNGFELFEQIKNKDPKAKACFVSAFEVHEDEIKKHMLEHVRNCVVKKPISVKELAEFINREIASG